MKFVKGISLFVAYPLLLLGLGFCAGLEVSRLAARPEEERGSLQLPMGLPSGNQTLPETTVRESGSGADEVSVAAEGNPETENRQNTEREEIRDTGREEEFVEAASSDETLCVDTSYIVRETDILHHTAVETSQRLPDKYIGMNREQFLQAMEVYEAFPPLSEMERGFVNLEVISFSRERVVVQMNYKYVQPSESFYLAVYNNEVIVYLEDRKTVYIETKIPLDSLPEQLQHDIIAMMWIENEEKLYDFLENYSS